MSLQTVLTTAFQRIATEFNTIRSEIAALGGGGGNSCIKVFCVGQSDLNDNTTFTRIVLSDTGKIGTITGASVNETDDEINLPAGKYKYSLFTNLSGSVARSNLKFRSNVDDTEYQVFSGMNYIRAASGHNSAGNFAGVDYFELGSTGTISFDGAREAAAGTVTLAADSFILIEKIG